jgi:hypothetical protein
VAAVDSSKRPRARYAVLHKPHFQSLDPRHCSLQAMLASAPPAIPRWPPAYRWQPARRASCAGPAPPAPATAPGWPRQGAQAAAQPADQAA